MDYNALKKLVGEDNAIVIYDYFIGYTTDKLIQLVLNGYTAEQLIELGKTLNPSEEE